jgi:hypothetical protein
MDPPDIQFQPNGYLVLAAKDEAAEILARSNKMQKLVNFNFS